MRWSGVLVAMGALLAVAPACTNDAAPGQASTPQSSPMASNYGITATTQCLESRGAIVADVIPSDSRLQALHDLAQRTSRQVVLTQGTVGLAFAARAEDAQALAELLAVPDDPYRIVVQHNVVLMYRSGAQAAFTIVVDCLEA